MQAINTSREANFDAWSKWKLSLYSNNRIDRFLKPVEILVSRSVSAQELRKLRQNIRDFNYSLYKINEHTDFDLSALSNFGAQLGLTELDANLCAEDDQITILTDYSNQDDSSKSHQRYIPYSNRPLGWHTDGYYNPQHQRVRSFILHCVQPASVGGDNSFIDPDIVYILLKQRNPDFIEALENPEVMRIPENRDSTGPLRPETSTAVFQVSPDDSQLDMRYSQRKKHIVWRDDPLTREALANLNDLLDSNSKWLINYRLKASEGIVSNNVLHKREAYQDDTTSPRVYYRARYYNRAPVA